MFISSLKALLPLILIALFFTALVVTLIVMGIRGILKKKGYGIHDEYSVFVIPRKTPGPNFYFLSVPKIMKKLAGTVT